MSIKLTGHKTESVYRRYAIVNEADLKEGVAKLAKLHESQLGPSSPTVVPLSGRKRQCYYATYFLLVCVQFAATRKIQRNHEPTINYATNSLVHWLPVPWRMRVQYDNKTLLEFPVGTVMLALRCGT